MFLRLIKAEWQSLAAELKAQHTENERLRQAAAAGGADDAARVHELNEELTKLKLENSALSKDIKELTAARDNETRAHEARVKVRLADNTAATHRPKTTQHVVLYFHPHVRTYMLDVRTLLQHQLCM